MKIYSLPKELPYKPDYQNYDPDAAERQVEAHKEALAAFLREAGYTGKRTGEILSIPFADGYANYMYADARGSGTGARSALVHLPYYDGWHAPEVEFLPQREVLARIDHQKKIDSMFG